MRGLALAFALAASSCAHAPDPIITSGQTLHLAADEFVATAAMMDKALELGLLSAPQYKTWADFVVRFKEGFHLAREAWVLAAQTNDIAGRNGAQAALESLLSQLSGFYVEVSLLFAHPPGGTP